MNIQILDIIMYFWLFLCLLIVVTAFPHVIGKEGYHPLSRLEKIVFEVAVVKGIIVLIILKVFFGGIF